MTRTLFLIALSALVAGCTANPGGDTPPSSPTDPPPPADGPLLRCTTAAFESDVFAPHQALRLQSNIDGDDSNVVELSLGAAHPDSEGVVAEPDASWEERASLTWSEQGFDLSGADLTLSTWEWEGMYLGTVDHAEQGSHEVTCWFDDFEATYRYDGDSEGSGGHRAVEDSWAEALGELDGKMGSMEPDLESIRKVVVAGHVERRRYADVARSRAGKG